MLTQHDPYMHDTYTKSLYSGQIVCKWFMSYLPDRINMFVLIDYYLPPCWFYLEFTMQGSILGPLLLSMIYHVVLPSVKLLLTTPIFIILFVVPVILQSLKTI